MGGIIIKFPSPCSWWTFGGAILISMTVAFFAPSGQLCSPMRIWLIFYVQCPPSPNWTYFQFYVTKQDRRIYYIVLDIILSSQSNFARPRLSPYLESGLYRPFSICHNCIPKKGVSLALVERGIVVHVWLNRNRKSCCAKIGLIFWNSSLMQELLIVESYIVADADSTIRSDEKRVWISLMVRQVFPDSNTCFIPTSPVMLL